MADLPYERPVFRIMDRFVQIIDDQLLTLRAARFLLPVFFLCVRIEMLCIQQSSLRRKR